MRQQLILLALCLVPSVSAQHPVEWRASDGLLPTDSVPVWGLWETIVCGPTSATLSPGALLLDTSACPLDIHAYSYASTGGAPPPIAMYWVEADVRVVASTAPNNGFGAATIRLYPGPICPYSIELSEGELAVRYGFVSEQARLAVDTTSAVRTWRLEIGAGVRVYVDGQQLLSLPGPTTSTCSFAPDYWGGVQFGDVQQGQGGVAEWVAVRHNLGREAHEFCFGGTPNSSGRVARLSWSGSRNVAANAFVLRAQDAAPGAPAYFLCSAAAAAASPVQGSQATLCLGGAIGRLNRPGEVLQTSALGATSLALDLSRLPGPLGSIAVAPGERWHFQLWYRDTNPTATSNMSSGLQVLFE